MRVATRELHVLEEQVGEAAFDRATGEVRHHLGEHVVGEVDGFAPGVAVGEHRGERKRTDRVLLFGGEPGLVVERGRHLGERVIADPRRVAGHVHERAEERGHVDLGEGGGDRRVVVGEGMAGVGVPHARSMAAHRLGVQLSCDDGAT